MVKLKAMYAISLFENTEKHNADVYKKDVIEVFKECQFSDFNLVFVVSASHC